ncbi:MAG: sigma-70 family RNA polymerase sigma factor, partial [Clostridia bacterium]|nr:sigma-70 family RNA polymerase sigma factor [Clostridia bacterium]
KQHRREERRKQYVSDCIENSEIITISLYAMQADENDDIISGEELIADPAVDVEEQALHKIDLETLHQALTALSDKELWLVHRLFLSETPVTELQLSRETGIPQKTLNDRKMRALKKLEKYIKK